MSRIGRSPITVPKGVDINIKKTEVAVKGPKGQLTVPVSPRLTVKQEDGEIHVERPTDNRIDRAQHGLARSLINNAVVGVTEGFSRNLQIQGVGYRCVMKGQNLELALGFSHPVVITPPEGHHHRRTRSHPHHGFRNRQATCWSSGGEHPRNTSARFVSRQRCALRR